MIEYALILSVVTLFALGALQLTAGTIVNLVNYVASAITGAGSPGSTTAVSPPPASCTSHR